MTPNHLQALIHQESLQPSIIAYSQKIELSRLVQYLNGDENALTNAEQAALDDCFVGEGAERTGRIEVDSIYNGLGEYIRVHSVAFLFENQCELELASGTLVRVADRLFVATVGHAVRPTQMLELIGDNSIYVEKTVEEDGKHTKWKGEHCVPVLGHRKHSRLDVGFFEIDTRGLGILRRSAIDLSGISLQNIQYGRIAFVFGYPAELMREWQHGSMRGALRFASVTYANSVMAPSEWPSIPKDCIESDQDADCFMRYSQADPMNVAPIGQLRGAPVPRLPDQLPQPYGLSGGGFWQSWVPNERRVWSPSNYQLFAIQSSWNSKENYIRAIRIHHWLNLVSDSYPDLKPLIEDHVASSSLNS